MSYNGLESDLKTLAKFVFIYETRLKNMHTERSFRDLYPKTFVVFLNIKKAMSFAKSSELNDNSIRLIRNATLYFTKRNCLVLDFMRHLRNSFCHALLKKEEKAYLLVDNYRGRVSCRGYLPSKLVVDFLAQLNQECEEKITCKNTK